MMKSYFLDSLHEHKLLFDELHKLNDAINQTIDVCSKSLTLGHKIMFCGNGGSAADSQHLAAEFTGRFVKDRRPLAAIALSTDTSALTCISNDYSFREIFSRQIYALGKEGDCLVAISTSGSSSNVVEAVKAAKSLKITTIGLLGYDGGLLREICDIPIVVPNSTTARVQEAHILIGHSICGGVELSLGLM